MTKKYLSWAIILWVLMASCTQERRESDPLQKVLQSENPDIKRVMDSLEQYEVQIRYTQIDRRNDSIFFSDYDFQVDVNNYFYPASTVKFPIAVLALERLRSIDSLNMNTRFYIEGDSVETTFANEMLKIFAVSDNDANNRLLEYLGQDAINLGLERKGVVPVRIAHRLGTHTEEVTTKPLIIYLNDSTTTTTKPSINSEPIPLVLNKVRKGSGYYEDDSLVKKPFDFGRKNYYPIQAQHGLLKRIIFPQNFIEKDRFDLNEEDRTFLLNAMQTLPKNLGYDPVEFYDGYCKYFMFGDTKDPIPDTIKIYNKIGFAYGTLTDCAYITDTKNKVEFMMTATILVNKDGIFNDDHYEYDQVGIPFLAALGREIYQLELHRKQ